LTAAGAGLCVLALLFGAASASAQQLEPRSYTNTPVGLNFLLAGYGYTEGNLSLDPSVPIDDAQLRTNSAVLGYSHSLGISGLSGKVAALVPYTGLEGSALVDGQSRQRDVSGFGDPLLRFNVNFYGAPALSLRDFAGYRQDFVVGGTLLVSAPLGQYDSSKVVNIGTNRWSVKAELGFSKTWGPWTVEGAPSVTWFTDNNDFLNGGTIEQEPLYAAQAHLIYGFQSGVWLALDGTVYTGARTTVNGVEQDNEQSNTRLGFTAALPVNRYNSVKLYGSTGTSSRTGSDYDGLGIAWQYRWGGGF
jgi:hypothetical protein